MQEEWESALKRSTAKAIERFAEMYAVSPYAAAARKWLTENRNRDVGNFTQISPSAADAQWSAPKETKTAKVTGPLAFDRSGGPEDLSSDRSVALLKSASVADILIEAGEVVLLAKMSVRSEPSPNAPILKTYPFGTKLRVAGGDDTGT